MTEKYVPFDPPFIEDRLLADWLKQELLRIAAAFPENDMYSLEKTTAAPARVSEGDIRLADGIGWNPGSGAGFYGYRNGAWRFLG